MHIGLRCGGSALCHTLNHKGGTDKINTPVRRNESCPLANTIHMMENVSNSVLFLIYTIWAKTHISQFVIYSTAERINEHVKSKISWK